MVRAAIMGSLSLLGQLIGRRQAGLNTLAFVAALMCLGVSILLWDVSFLLTFGATLGLVLFASRLQGSAVRWPDRAARQALHTFQTTLIRCFGF